MTNVIDFQPILTVCDFESDSVLEDAKAKNFEGVVVLGELNGELEIETNLATHIVMGFLWRAMNKLASAT